MHVAGEIEERAANAWPPAVLQFVDGWRLRFGGTMLRTNSVLPYAQGRLALADKLALAEEWYDRRGAAAMFHISPAAHPAELDDELERRGYRELAPTLVQTAQLAALPAPSTMRFGVALAETPDAEWFDAYALANQLGPDALDERRGILRRIGPRTAFVRLSDGDGAAVGIGVVERGWLGMFSIATHVEWRRRGAATAVVQALAAWGRHWGAVETYLQVEERNEPGRALYERLGFRTRYRYHYRQARPLHEPA